MKKRMKLIVLLVALLTIGGISAYFVDKDTIQNTFTVGSVDIFLDEPNWEEEDKVFPNQTLPKDPQVTNIGDNDAYIFVEVEVPYATVRTESTNGIVSPSKEQELFTYDVNEGWVEISSTKDEEKGVVMHLYAYAKDYSMIALKPDITTQTVFDTISYINVIDGEANLENSVQNVVVTAKAIQTNGLDGATTPQQIYKVLNEQRNANN